MVKLRSNRLGLVVLSFLWLNLTQAQESFNAAGGDASGSGGTAAYSIGQLAYTSNTDATGSSAQGVQQAYEIFIVGLEQVSTWNISLKAFPNPTTHYLNLELNELPQNEDLFYQVFDVHGRLLSHVRITSELSQINMNDLIPATYFVNVVNQSNKKFQSFKIIKR